MNLLHARSDNCGVPWSTKFNISLCTIWKIRNDGVFSNESKALSPHSLRHAIHIKVKLWHLAWMAPSPLQLRGQNRPDRVAADIGWVAPPRGWCKLNIDGASQGNQVKQLLVEFYGMITVAVRRLRLLYWLLFGGVC
ncbi:unnamed protein product [Linum trigynum]|uniref:Uncharacterized protein n=1 Tax=Linum trigynum TaxID=586398 RepID=A0AAV2CII0_9ROSI